MADIMSELERVVYEYICSIAGNLSDGSGKDLEASTGVSIAGPLGDTSIFRFGVEDVLTIKRLTSATEFKPPQIVVSCTESDDDIVTGNSTCDVEIAFAYPLHDTADSTNVTARYAEACGGLRGVLFRSDIHAQLNRYANESVSVQGLVSRSQSRSITDGYNEYRITLKLHAANKGISDSETAN